MARCLLALGSNLGDRLANMTQCCAEIARHPPCRLLARSQWHATAPIGGADGQGEFLNGALVVETSLAPNDLAAELRAIENRMGRQRAVRWDARTMDIDLLLYDQEVIETESLTVPHPRMSFRRFVLEPAAEIAGSLVHPTSGWTIAQLLDHLQQSRRLVLVTSKNGEIAACLVSHLSEQLKCPVWQDAEKGLVRAGISPSGENAELPASETGLPPVIAQLSPPALERHAASALQGGVVARPALVIMVDAGGKSDPPVGDGAGSLYMGPVAKITTDDPATIRQEAEAAIRCVWPDLS